MIRTLRMARFVGTALVAAGIIACLSYLFLREMPLGAAGLGSMILGLTRLALDGTGDDGLARADSRLWVALLAAFVALVILLGSLRVRDIAVYFICFALVFFVFTLGSPLLERRSRARVNRVSSVLFVGFLVVLAIKLVQMVG